MAKKSSEDQERERCRHHIEELTKKIDSMEGGNVSMGFSPISLTRRGRSFS